MSNPYFSFKQFTVWHDKCAMKVGTDGVLLGAWTNVTNATYILDIGTGSGLVALMLAQRCNATILAIDIDHEAAMQAKKNVLYSPWPQQIEVMESDFCAMEFKQKFDVIVSNPPYFVNSLVCPDFKRTTARHADSLNYQSLFEGVSANMAANGEFSVVLPANVVPDVVKIAAKYALFLSRWVEVVTSPGKQAKRNLLAFRFGNSSNIEHTTLLIEQTRHCYSDEFQELVRDYYLHI